MGTITLKRFVAAHLRVSFKQGVKLQIGRMSQPGPVQIVGFVMGPLDTVPAFDNNPTFEGKHLASSL